VRGDRSHAIPPLPRALDRQRARRVVLSAGRGRQTVGRFYFRHNKETAHHANVGK
jgi:hypothetical protein